MTEVRTTLRSCYLAGPMRGIEEHNFPAFHKQAAWLRANGWTVFSPAENDEEQGFNPKTDTAKKLAHDMEHDLPAVCRADAVVLLPGWEESKGARLEALVAVEVGHPVFEIVYRLTDRPELGDQERCLDYVDPEHVRQVFYLEGEDGVVPETATGASLYPDLVAKVEDFDFGELLGAYYAARLGVTLPDKESFSVRAEDLVNGTLAAPEMNEDQAAMGISPEPRHLRERHPNSARFHEHLDSLGKLHDEKQKGYGTDADPFANVRGSEKWGVPAWVGAMVRANDKIVRLQSYVQKGSLPFEAVEDAFKDLAVYAIIGLCLYEEAEGKGS